QPEEITREVQQPAGGIGHKRLIAVYGESPETDIDYMQESLRTIYAVKEKTRCGWGQIRRVNVNAAPLSIESLRRLKEAGIGTYQVFQETYHRKTYAALHPQQTPKSDYRWRLYCMHRALEAGIDDVGIGALFGLYDWRYEALAMVLHARELEAAFGLGPHTISFPRLEPADHAPYAGNSPYQVADDDFLKLVMVLRLAIPYAGMIITARETAAIRNATLKLGYTQTDASTRLGIGAYSEPYETQQSDRQQFILGDTRSLDELVADLARAGYITSFCTAGYRCGRTGALIMDLLKSGKEGVFCKLNAILTFREWLDDFASASTKGAGEVLIERELEEASRKLPELYPTLREYYRRIAAGERDLYL
ncbi:MAG: [FeFe] hydrogenase H-cluster radical SAM maturase HydG, partial [Candidatus Omnitrophica bacterium]|nr:[FeFe] hydrogenase H-cluster radical SAM maturase HydG [Candidatus Omnitrophota bacterium]